MKDHDDAFFSEEAIAQRADMRRSRISAHRSADFEEADQWDLRYWPTCLAHPLPPVTPGERPHQTGNHHPVRMDSVVYRQARKVGDQ